MKAHRAERKHKSIRKGRNKFLTFGLRRRWTRNRASGGGGVSQEKHKRLHIFTRLGRAKLQGYMGLLFFAWWRLEVASSDQRCPFSYFELRSSCARVEAYCAPIEYLYNVFVFFLLRRGHHQLAAVQRRRWIAFQTSSDWRYSISDWI